MGLYPQSADVTMRRHHPVQPGVTIVLPERLTFHLHIYSPSLALDFHILLGFCPWAAPDTPPAFWPWPTVPASAGCTPGLALRAQDLLNFVQPQRRLYHLRSDCHQTPVGVAGSPQHLCLGEGLRALAVSLGGREVGPATAMGTF